MLKKILAASPQSAFGELLRLSLEKGSDYQVQLASNGGEVLSFISRDNFDLAILDAELKDQPFVPLIQNLHVQQPQMRILVIPQTAGITRQSLKSVTVDGFLEKPINFSDLLHLVEKYTREEDKLINVPNVVKPVVTPGGKPIEARWIEERSEVQQNLFRLAARSPAEAVFIMQERQVWAQASKQDQDFNIQVIDLFARAWDRKTNLDLVKLFRSGAERRKWLLYATSLVQNYVLVMVFSDGMPMHQVHGHVIRMANGLSDASLFDVKGDNISDFLGTIDRREAEKAANQETQNPDVPHSSPPPLPQAKPEKRLEEDEHRITVVIAPRLRTIQLITDLKDSIRIWIPQVCATSGWYLEELTIRPDHLQCVCIIPDSAELQTAPDLLKQKLGAMIFKLFPAYRQQGEFWADKCIYETGNGVITGSAIQHYLHQFQMDR